MRTLFQRLFSPGEEPSNDPRVVIEATLTAESRLRQYGLERAERMKGYAEKWPSSDTSAGNVLKWREHGS
jgi:hypothetical protein